MSLHSAGMPLVYFILENFIGSFDIQVLRTIVVDIEMISSSFCLRFFMVTKRTKKFKQLEKQVM